MRPAQTACQDYEYERNGKANLFLWVEALAGRRRVLVTQRHTARDFAEAIQELVDAEYPDAEKSVLVTDNLNIHKPGSLYERFEAQEAHRLANKSEWHYTPEHGSWLNMAEGELSVLQRHCLSRRIPDAETLTLEAAAWEGRRNRAQVTLDWHFTTADARIQLKRLYPVVKEQETEELAASTS